ncbi:MAG: hypothetical protein WDN06_22360 [Asticcacaulis sp.]
MPTDDRTRTPNTKFLINKRTSLAGDYLDDSYSRRLSQYGESAMEPAYRQVWNFDTDIG